MISFRTVSDLRIDLSDPKITDVDVRDIACALSKICRFTGHLRDFYSVAQHAVYVAWLLPERLRYAGLHHDDSEAYMNDLSRHLKHSPALEGYRFYEHQWSRTIEAALSIRLSEDDRLLVKAADDVVAVFEEHVVRHGRTWSPEFIDHALAEGFISARSPRDYVDHLARRIPEGMTHHRSWTPHEAEMMFLRNHGVYWRLRP